jgi:hypothetical protein
LAANAAKGYFFGTPVLFILLRKMNKTGVPKKFILPSSRKAGKRLFDGLIRHK